MTIHRHLHVADWFTQRDGNAYRPRCLPGSKGDGVTIHRHLHVADWLTQRDGNAYRLRCLPGSDGDGVTIHRHLHVADWMTAAGGGAISTVGAFILKQRHVLMSTLSGTQQPPM